MFAGVINLLRGSGMVVMSRSVSDMPAKALFCGGVAGKEALEAMVLEVCVLDLGLTTAEKELTMGFWLFEWERR